jgi:hypothetical protein
MPRYVVALAGSPVLVHNLEVGPRDDLPPLGRPRLLYQLGDLFAAAAPGEAVQDVAWRQYRNAQGLGDGARPWYSVTPAGPGTTERELVVEAASADEALAKFKLYAGVVGSLHEAEVGALDEAAPAGEKKGT